MADLPIPESLVREAAKAPPPTTPSATGELPVPTGATGGEPGGARRLTEIGGKKLAEGAGAAVGAPSLLLGMLYGLMGEGYEKYPKTTEAIARSLPAGLGIPGMIAGPNVKELATRLQQAGQLPIDLAHRIFGKAPEAETTGERVVGAVAENIGAAAVPFGAGQVGIALKGGRAVAMQTTGFLSRLAALPPAKLAAIETAVSTGAGVGQAGARSISDNETACFIGQLIGAFGVGGALGLIRSMRGGKFTQAGAKAKVGKELAEAVPAGSAYEKSLTEAIALKGETGIQPSTAAATQSPRLARLEQAGKAVIPETGTKLAEQEAASSLAVQRQSERVLGAPGGQVGEAQAAATQALAAKRTQITNTANTLMGELDNHVASAKQSVDAAVSGLGSLGSREASGEAIRNALTARHADLKVKAGELFSAVDPENAVALSPTPIQETIKQIVGETETSLRSDIVPGVIRRLGEKVAPKLTEEQEQLVQAAMNSMTNPTREGAIAFLRRSGENIAAVAPEVSFNTLRGWRSDLLGEIRDAARSANPNSQAIRNLNRVVDAVDETLDQARNLPGDAGEAYRTASDFYKQMQQRFSEGTVAAVMQRGPRGAELRTKIEDVAGAFFRGSTEGGKSSAAADFVAAVGDVSAARQGLRDYALRDFLSSAYDNGVLNTRRGTTWLKSHEDVLGQFPDVRSEVQGLMRQGRTYDDVMAQAKIARPEIERLAKADRATLDKSALAIFTKGDPDEAVRLVMGRADAAQKMAELTRTIGGDAAAMRGLRQGVWDFAKARIAGPNLDATGNLLTEPTKLRTFLSDHEAALRVVYTPAEMANVKKLVRAAELSISPSPAPGGAGLDIDPEQLYKMKEGFSRVWTAVKWVSPEYVVAEATARGWWRVMHNIGAGNMRRLYDAALTDPEVAKSLIDATRKRATEEQAIRTLKGALLRLGGPPAESD